MRSLLSATLLLWMSGCSVTGSFRGTLVDGLTGGPIAGVRVLAKAPKALDLSCQAFEATTAEDGSFAFDKLCDGETYTLEIAGDDTLLLDNAPTFDGGEQATDPVTVRAWRGSKGKGLYLLTDGNLERVKTASDIVRKKILDSDEEVAYPAEIPPTIPLVAEGSWLVVSGEGAIKKYQFLPLIESKEKRRFGTSREFTTLEPWFYAGVRFRTDTDTERVTVEMDRSKVKEVLVGGWPLRYIAADALPPGRYAVFGKHDRRMYLIDFGKAPEAGAEQ